MLRSIKCTIKIVLHMYVIGMTIRANRNADLFFWVVQLQAVDSFLTSAAPTPHSHMKRNDHVMFVGSGGCTDSS